MLAQLRREKIAASERQIRRVFRHLGVSRQVARIRSSDSSKPHPRFPNRLRHVDITGVDQGWVADLTYLRFERRFFYLAVILDAHSRGVRGWALGSDWMTS